HSPQGGPVVAFQLRAEDEGRHIVGTDELWGESWYHDFAAADGSYGGYARLGLYPNLDIAWYWVYLVRRGEPLVLIRDHAAPCPPKGAPLDLSGERFTASWRCTDPLSTWRITTEGTRIAVADPATAFHREGGADVAVRIDLEWRGVAPVFPYPEATRYEQAAWVEGEMIIGDQRIAVHCPGERDHSWGRRDWWSFPWLWTAGRLDDGTWFHGGRSLVTGAGASNFQTGFVVDPDLTMHRIEAIEFEPQLDAEKLLIRADLDLAGLRLYGWAELNWPDGWPQ